MNLTKEKEWEYRARFDSFIKKVIKNELRNLWKAKRYIAKHEKAWDDCSQSEMEQIHVPTLDPLEVYEMKVLGHWVEIHGSEIFSALHTLAEDKRTVILLYYYLGMNDSEIAKRLDLGRRNVTKIRNRTLNLLRRIMEES